ncbi:SDR family oxidoreductase [Halococcus thailandensis]|uniref:Peroxisomal trans-2-enoyl-CoA reductase n=1 Tax=Halococcus thailandensis JCM 13552 TaxID=1227457 RepID=M0N2Z1_9EURY|nr:SDR family oxidoreductase [Halococcus thailandensis]EMA51479.1 dehydrogenase/ reductase 10 [Halococcus thailandensis JCM 13552]
MAGLGPTPPVEELFADDLLAGEVALVTGGGTGIGRAIALGLAECGADVAIASRELDHLEPVADEIEERGVEACATTVDVREYDAVEAMVDTVVEELGGIDVLVNNAGANFLGPTESLTPNGWRAVVGTILDGTAYCTFAVGEQMIDEGGGAIVSMGATNSVRGAPYHAHSGAGKAGVHNLMQTVASEWASCGIRANTVAPGIVETEGVTEAAGGELPDAFLDDVPADRFGTPADCVPTVLFLASPAAAYVTGGYFTVDGGQLLAPTPF